MRTFNEIISDILVELENYIVTSQNKIMPKVSIIVPAYNAEKYIVDCLISLIKQTLREIEIIVIDDGSTDSTYFIACAFAAKDKRIKIIQQSNQKQGAARNRGIEIAQGEYIGFVDSDDYIDLDYYEKLYNTAKSCDCDIVTTNLLKHKKKNNKYNVFYKKQETTSSLDAKFKLCEDKSRRFFFVMNRLFKTSVIKENNILFPEGSFSEDVMFSTKAIFYANKIVSCPETEYHYIEHATSTINSKTNKQKKIDDRIQAYIELHKFAKEKNIELPERLNYFESYWQAPFLKIYRGYYKEKVTLFGYVPIAIKRKDTV